MLDRWEEKEKEITEPKRDKSTVNLNVDIVVLKPNTFLEPPGKPVIYLSEKKTKEFVRDLLNALKHAKDGVVINITGEINPQKQKEDFDGSLFITRELRMKKEDLKLK